MREPRGCSPHLVRHLSPRQSLAFERLRGFSQDRGNRSSVITSTPAASPNTSQSFQQISVIIRRAEESSDEVFEVNDRKMEDAKKELEKVRNKLLRKKQATTLNSVISSTVDRTFEFTQALRQDVINYGDLYDDFLVDYTNELENPDHFKVQNNQIIEDVIAHIDQLEVKADEVKKASRDEAIQLGVNASQEAQTAQLQDLLTRQASLDSTKEINVAKKRAQTKAAQVTSDVNKLDLELKRIDLDAWAEAPDKDIEAGVKKLDVWQAKLDNIISRYREVEDILSSQDVRVRDIYEASEAGRKVKDVEVLFDEVRYKIEFEDESRELYSGTTATTEKVSYPVFEGRDDECYPDFKLEIEKAFTKNKVAKSDKVKKLRECLRGYAKKLVPESLKDIDIAYDSLNNAYGDPTKLQRHRTSAIKKLGKLPKTNAKGQSIVEWYLSLEVIIQGILDLGEKIDDVDIKNCLYSTDVVRNIASLFPENMGKKILKVNGYSRERLENVLAKVVEYRGDAHLWTLNQEMTENGASASGSGQSGVGDGGLPRGGGHGHGGGGGHRASHVNVSLQDFNPSLVFFNPPQNYPDWRICQVLEERGDTHQLYDNHHQTGPLDVPGL